MTYDNTNKGALFKNNRKKRDTHPDYTGSINVEGHDYWLSGWLKTDKTGRQYMSTSVKRKDGTADRPQEFVREAKKHFPDAELDDSVPF